MGVILFTLFVLTISHGAFWFVSAQKIREAVELWISDQRSAGLIVEHQSLKMRGYPLVWRAELKNVTFGQDERASALWRWRVDALNVIAAPHQLTSLKLIPKGEQHLTAKGIGDWRAQWRDVKVRLAHNGESGWLATLEGDTALIEQQSTGRTLTFENANISIRPKPSAPDQINAAIGIKNAVISLKDNDDKERRVHAPILETDLTLTHSAYLLANGGLNAWRDATGKLLLDRIALDIEGAKGLFDGALSIDADHYLAGQVNADIKDPGKLARALGVLGVIPPETAQAAEAGLSLAALAQGGKIKGPIILQNGAASLLGVKLAKLPQIK